MRGLELKKRRAARSAQLATSGCQRMALLRARGPTGSVPQPKATCSPRGPSPCTCLISAGVTAARNVPKDNILIPFGTYVETLYPRFYGFPASCPPLIIIGVRFSVTQDKCPSNLARRYPWLGGKKSLFMR